MAEEKEISLEDVAKKEVNWEKAAADDPNLIEKWMWSEGDIEKDKTLSALPPEVEY